MSKLHTAYIGLGSNLDDRTSNCREAICLMKESGQIKVSKLSEFRETKPEGGANQPKYINAVAEIKTALSPKWLLKLLQEIEKTLGRPTPRTKGTPRTIDLDILIYDDAIVSLPDLEIPHPRLSKRSFVLLPVCDIAPALVHPQLGVRMDELLSKLRKENLEE